MTDYVDIPIEIWYSLPPRDRVHLLRIGYHYDTKQGIYTHKRYLYDYDFESNPTIGTQNAYEQPRKYDFRNNPRPVNKTNVIETLPVFYRNPVTGESLTVYEAVGHSYTKPVVYLSDRHK